MTTYRFIGASKAAVEANSETLKHVVAAGKVIALRALDVQRQAVKTGSDMLARNRNPYAEQLRQSLMSAHRSVDDKARQLVNGTADQAVKALDKVATLIERNFLPRLEHAFKGKVVKSLERYGVPAAEVARDISERVNAASDKVLKFAAPKPTAKTIVRRAHAKVRANARTVTKRGVRRVQQHLKAAA